MNRIYKRAAARRDLEDHFVHLAQNAGQDVAERFLISAESSFADLAHQPLSVYCMRRGIGGACLG